MQNTLIFQYKFYFLVSLVLLVVGGALFLGYRSDGDTIADTTASIVVSSPAPGVVLSGTSFFVASLHDSGLDMTTVRVFWDIEKGVLRGEMPFDGKNFISDVDTSTWDWKKDGAYTLAFFAEDANGQTIADTSFVVHVDTSVSPENASSTNTQASNSGMQGTATTYRALPATPSVTPALSSTGANMEDDFWVEWVPAPAHGEQTFIYHIKGYRTEESNAFWKTEGGHLNSVYSANATTPFIAKINMSSWKWLGKGPYKITFLLTSKKTSEELSSEDFELYWKGTPGESDVDAQSKEPVSKKAPVPLPQTAGAEPTPNSSAVAVPRVPAGKKLFVPSKPAVEKSLSVVKTAVEKEIVTFFLNQPSSIWLNGDGYDTTESIQTTLAKARAQSTVPVFVLYNIPHRDCGSASSGGAKSASEYKAWIDRLSSVLKDSDAMLVVEPDALAQINCVSSQLQTERLELLRYAVLTLTNSSPKLRLYVDAGHPFWVSAEEMANRLESVGVSQARGFALNSSNYARTQDAAAYGKRLSTLLGGKYYIVDTSRNGNGPSTNMEWCNPSGRAVGDTPVLLNGAGYLDALVWVKFPGESDGYCNGGPSAGIWWAEYALGLYNNR